MFVKTLTFQLLDRWNLKLAEMISVIRKCIAWRNIIDAIKFNIGQDDVVRGSNLIIDWWILK